MDNYEWQKNKAVVDRCYYSERVFTSTTIGATFFTLANICFMRNNYFAATVRARIIPTWVAWGVVNVVAINALLWPLTNFEIKQQWNKRLIMGKYLYSVFHLEEAPEVAAPATPAE